MQVVILCGGRGSRLGQESDIRPKPMVTVGERPILWHIMKYYASFGHRDFVLCLGYKGDVIRDYFLNYETRQNDVTVDLGREGGVTVHGEHDEQGWRVTLADTGLETMTGGRVARIRRFITSEPFLLTYGDGVADIDLHQLIAFHRQHGKIATVTAVHPPARFGELVFSEGRVELFAEKPQVGSGLINGGFFVFDRRIFDYIPNDPQCSLEREPLLGLVRDGQMMAYRHDGFWQCVDTVRELEGLRQLWESGGAPWRAWERVP